KLPLVSLGLWHNFGHDREIDGQRAIIRRAFDLGITHFDLANNYGPPNGAAEENFGRILREDLAGHRDELVISTKAGYDMWEGLRAIAFSPLAQGMLTTKYLDGIPADSRAAEGRFLTTDMITPERIAHVRRLNEIAGERGQSLAQMALAWTLRDERVTSALIGASSVKQLEENVAAIGDVEFTAEELAAIDRDAVDAGINIWQQSSDA